MYCMYWNVLKFIYAPDDNFLHHLKLSLEYKDKGGADVRRLFKNFKFY